jgi:hypothetical protein
MVASRLDSHPDTDLYEEARDIPPAPPVRSCGFQPVTTRLAPFLGGPNFWDLGSKWAFFSIPGKFFRGDGAPDNCFPSESELNGAALPIACQG